MERLKLGKPRSTILRMLPLSPAIPLGVHWHERSWICSQEHGSCRLCSIVKRRPVVYFAAACKTSMASDVETVLIERSAHWYHEVCRQSGTNWSEVIGRLCVNEHVQGKEREVQSTVVFEDDQLFDLVSMERVAYSIAALYQFPRFPGCSTILATQIALEGFSTRQQMMLLPNLHEVNA